MQPTPEGAEVQTELVDSETKQDATGSEPGQAGGTRENHRYVTCLYCSLYSEYELACAY